jgi:curved DNA-binding protein CbpA
MFTPDEQKQLTTTGNGGRVFELEMTPGGEKVPALVSLDKITNRFEAVPLSEIQIPKMLKGVELSQEQQEGLLNGQGVLVENMDKKQRPGEELGTKITRIIQYNAVNKNFDFLFTPQQREQYGQERAAKAEQDNNKPLKARKVGDVWVRPVQGGVELTREQFKELLDNKPVWVEGMTKQQPKPQQGAQQVEATDKKGQKYNAWVWADQDAGRIRHTTLPPDQWKAAQAKKQAQPAEGFKTQVAVNNEGKTNEATKHSTDPLKKGQTRGTERQQQTPRTLRKNTGVKM